MMNQDVKLVTIFGGSGFLGRHIASALVRRDVRLRIAVRRPELAHFLQPIGGPGQIVPVQANIRDRDSIARAMEGADAIVNLVGILFERGAQTFDTVQARGPAHIAELAARAGISRVVHMSAIGADDAGTAHYARSKAAGEAAIRDHIPAAVILRPSIVFGPEDDFFNRFAAMSRLTPVLPLFGTGATRFQPVYVGDVAAACTKAVMGEARCGQTCELGGPDILSFRECLELMLRIIGRQRIFAPLPFAMAGMMARPLEWLPKPPFTTDQVELLKYDNVVSENAIADGRDLAGLGIAPRALEAILPGYLGRFCKHGQYDSYQTGHP